MALRKIPDNVRSLRVDLSLGLLENRVAPKSTGILSQINGVWHKMYPTYPYVLLMAHNFVGNLRR